VVQLGLVYAAITVAVRYGLRPRSESADLR
jgi:hypothetical protein